MLLKMKWGKQVVLFAAKNNFKEKMTNKSGFYFLWYLEIRVENLKKKKKSLQIKKPSLPIVNLLGIILGLTGTFMELFL